MKLLLSPFLSAIFFFGGATAASDGTCLELETACNRIDADGNLQEDCSMIKQQERTDCDDDIQIKVTAKWCNNKSGVEQAISSDSRLRLSGPASDAAHKTNKPFDIGDITETVLLADECQSMEWETKISDCEAYFNYEVHINPDDECRGYFFERQMLRLCHLSNMITCDVADGYGVFQNCQTYNPCSLDACDCADGGRGCVRTVAYKFDYGNENANPLRFDLTPEEYTKAKTQGEIVNDYTFPTGLLAKDVGHDAYDEFTRSVNVDYCIEGPRATLNLRAEVQDKVESASPEVWVSDGDDYQFCWDFKEIKDAPEKGFDGCPNTASPSAAPSAKPTAKPIPSPSRGPTISPFVDVILPPPSTPMPSAAPTSGKGKGGKGKGSNSRKY